MSDDKIYGVAAYPDQEKLKPYEYAAPEGNWQGRFDERTWGKSMNLFCYFTDLATGEKRRLSVFANTSYQPSKGGPNFRNEALGGSYQIVTGKSKGSLPTFLQAMKI